MKMGHKFPSSLFDKWLQHLIEIGRIVEKDGTLYEKIPEGYHIEFPTVEIEIK